MRARTERQKGKTMPALRMFMDEALRIEDSWIFPKSLAAMHDVDRTDDFITRRQIVLANSDRARHRSLHERDRWEEPQRLLHNTQVQIERLDLLPAQWGI